MRKTSSTILILFSLASLLLVACGLDTSFLLVKNTSSADICEVNIVADGSSGWGANYLAGETIPAGTEYEIEDIESGVYDLRFVPCDEASFEATEEQNLDLSDNIEYTLFDL